ncbi:MAG TPA: 4Fe-4S binding protein [Clostridia bacterium]|nr:4Fe-4S binding protein [Clostridia bacterium]
MKINKELCIDCGKCMVYCPVSAIKKVDDEVIIDFDECVECGVCKRARVCPVDAIYQQELTYPRTIRSLMSDVLTVAQESQISGRGTEEMKTNEVTGRFREGWIGIGIEMGRPGVAAYISDVEKVAMAVAKEGVEFEKENPVTSMMADVKTGKFKEELLNERVLSAIIEFKVRVEKLEGILKALQEVAKEIDTVFSLAIAAKILPDGTIPYKEVVNKMGLWISPNAKTNVGLGRPLFVEKN